MSQKRRQSGKGVDSRQQGRREGEAVAKTFRVLLQARDGPGIGKAYFLTCKKSNLEAELENSSVVSRGKLWGVATESRRDLAH